MKSCKLDCNISPIQQERKVSTMIKSKRFLEPSPWHRNKSILQTSTSVPTSKPKCPFSMMTTMTMIKKKSLNHRQINLHQSCRSPLSLPPYLLPQGNHSKISFKNLLRTQEKLKLKNLRTVRLICLLIFNPQKRQFSKHLLHNKNLNLLQFKQSKKKIL